MNIIKRIINHKIVLFFILFTKEREIIKKEIPFSKKIYFDSNVYEISSISLDFEYLVNLSTIEGTYFVTGDYRGTEVSVNKTPFDFKIPFSIELTSEVNLDTIKLEIDDFNYKLNNNELSLDINLNLEYDEVELEEPNLDDDLDNREFNPDELMDLIDNPTEEVVEEKTNEETTEIIMEEEVSSYQKYQVHIIKENESLDDILKLYQVTEGDLASINDSLDITPGNKLIIEKHD